MKLKNNIKNTFLYSKYLSNNFEIIIHINILLVLLFPIHLNYLGISVDSNYDFRVELLKFYYLPILLLNIITLIYYWVNYSRAEKYNIFIILSLFSLFISALFGLNFRFYFLIAIVFTISLFHVYIKTSLKNKFPYIIWCILMIYILLPLLILFDIINPFTDFMVINPLNFCGFSESRTSYGYLVTIAITLSLISKRYIVNVFAFILFIPLFISANRAGIVSVFFVFLYKIFFIEKKVIYKVIYICLLLLFIFFTLTEYSEYLIRNVTLFEDSGDRVAKISISFYKIFESPFLGGGDFFQQINDGLNGTVEPHNSILQTMINFGLLTTIFWYGLLVNLFFKSSEIARLFLLNYFVFSLFHPGFDGFNYTPEALISYLLFIKYFN